MDPNRYLEKNGIAASTKLNEETAGAAAPRPSQPEIPERKPVTASFDRAEVVRAAEPEPKPVRKRVKKAAPTGRLCVSGKRFFGQILIDHWVIRINGEQKKLSFGKNRMTVELPAGMYLVTAYTPYLGMHCMRVTADIEIRPGEVTCISYQTVFDIFRNGIIRQSRSVKM